MMTKLLTRKSLLLVSMLSLCSLSYVTAQAAEFKGILAIGGDFGGDTVGTVVYKDGSTTEATVNNGLALNVGAVRIDGPLETQATVGYKFGGPNAKDGSITWNAIPVELIEFYRVSAVRMGLGFSYNINPRLEINVLGTRQTYNFDNALGIVAQIDWEPAKQSYNIALRYTVIQYKQSGVSNAQEIGGNMVGIYVNYYF